MNLVLKYYALYAVFLRTWLVFLRRSPLQVRTNKSVRYDKGFRNSDLVGRSSRNRVPSRLDDACTSPIRRVFCADDGCPSCHQIRCDQGPRSRNRLSLRRRMSATVSSLTRRYTGFDVLPCRHAAHGHDCSGPVIPCCGFPFSPSDGRVQAAVEVVKAPLGVAVR